MFAFKFNLFLSLQPKLESRGYTQLKEKSLGTRFHECDEYGVIPACCKRESRVFNGLKNTVLVIDLYKCNKVANKSVNLKGTANV